MAGTASACTDQTAERPPYPVSRGECASTRLPSASMEREITPFPLDPSARLSGRLPKTGKECLSRFSGDQALLARLKTWILGKLLQALGHTLFWPHGKV